MAKQVLEIMVSSAPSAAGLSLSRDAFRRRSTTTVDDMIYRHILRPILFKFNGETAHHLAMIGLGIASVVPGCPRIMRSLMAPRSAVPVKACGVTFPNRLGVAAGWVKNGDALPAVWGLGFGFVEVGTVTAGAWGGNPKPRVHRLVRDEGMINRMGLPSQGWEPVRHRLEGRRPSMPVIVNVGKTASPDIHGDAAVADIVTTVRGMAPVADMLVLNLSCPNVTDGRNFENDADALTGLLTAVRAALAGAKVPLLVKLSPDMAAPDLQRIVDVSMACGVDGFVASNTTKSRDGLVQSELAAGLAGGLSGRPLRDRAVATVSAVRNRVGPAPLIIGCGGIFDGRDADMFMDAGANLLEGFTGFIFQGPLYCRQVIDTMRAG